MWLKAQRIDQHQIAVIADVARCHKFDHEVGVVVDAEASFRPTPIDDTSPPPPPRPPPPPPPAMPPAVFIVAMADTVSAWVSNTMLHSAVGATWVSRTASSLLLRPGSSAAAVVEVEVETALFSISIFTTAHGDDTGRKNRKSAVRDTQVAPTAECNIVVDIQANTVSASANDEYRGWHGWRRRRRRRPRKIDRWRSKRRFGVNSNPNLIVRFVAAGNVRDEGDLVLGDAFCLQLVHAFGAGIIEQSRRTGYNMTGNSR